MTPQPPPLTAPWEVKAPYLRHEPIGLRGLPDGAHTVRHPDGDVFLLIRRGRIVGAQLWLTARPGYQHWAADPGVTATGIRAGLQALARKVVMPAA
jgi:hypothetical protein